MYNSKKSAFTLVELIVVIVILAILATIAFLSFSSQSASARDSTRLSDMSNISKGLSVFNATTGSYPAPDLPVTISASGITIGKQGYAGSSVLNMIKISNGGKDPLDNSTYYTYSVNSNSSKFQILGFLEDGSSTALSMRPGFFIKPGLEWANADPSSYSGRYLIVKGDQIGILLSSGSLLPVQINSGGTTIDLVKAQGSSAYKAVFANDSANVNITTTGTGVFSSIYSKNSELLKNKTLAAYDDSLQAYWDMETLTADSSKLKDLSKNGNDGVCYNSGSIVNCGISGSGPQFSNSYAGIGKFMNFDGIDDAVINNLAPLGKNDFTFSLWVKTNNNNIFAIASSEGALWAGSEGFSIATVSTHQWWGADPGFINYYLRGNGSQFAGPSLQSKIENNVWYNVVSVRNGENMLIYINGKLYNKISNAGIKDINLNNCATSLFLGRNSWNNGFYSWFGGIDEPRIYNRALSDSEISTLYNSAK